MADNMTRRTFFQGFLATVSSAAIRPRSASSQEKKSQAIQYINPQIPAVKLPSYDGQRYKVQVPDTLDLADRAALAIRGLTNTTDPASDYEIYWAAMLDKNPLYMFHSWNDSCWVKYVDSLPLLRLASGSTANINVERRWLEVMLHMQGPDGLFYFPRKGKPWWQHQCYGPPPPGEHYTLPYCNGRLLNALAIYHQLTGDSFWDRTGRRVVDGLNELAVHQDRKAFFPWVQFGLGRKFTQADRSAVTHNFASWFAWTVQGLAQFSKATGYRPAEVLAGKLSRWIMEDSGHFDSQGRFLPEHPRTTRAHFHGHTMVLLALLDYGISVGDTKVIDFVRQSFEFARTNGNRLVGYFPEWLDGGTAETCQVADMVALALKLSRAGAGDYWDDADRWLRNQFAEAQLLRAEGIDEAVKNQFAKPPAGPHITTANVSQRIVGCFAAQASANDWVGQFPQCTQACCNGNGARTIYYAWQNILSYKDGELKVNLLLNRASPWADVESYLPYEGRVAVKLKDECDLAIRIPSWMETAKVTLMVNGKERTFSQRGSYAHLGRLKKDDQAMLSFPLGERSEKTTINGQNYTLVLRGNDVVHIDPPGKYLPLYRRSHYRIERVRFNTVTRFVSQMQLTI